MIAGRDDSRVDGGSGGFFGLFRRRRRAQPAVPTGARIYCIGDVHGRLDLLDLLLEQVRRDDAGRAAAQTEVVLLGDLIDRGPDSAGVVRRAMESLDWATLSVLKGNHEAAMSDALDGDTSKMKLWLRKGGDAALRSWGVAEQVIASGSAGEVATAATAAIPADQRRWLARRPLALQRGDYYFVHAGIRPGVALEEQRAEDALWIRSEFLSSTRDHGVTVVHGHSAAHEVEERPNRIGIDTGAHASGRLTALGLEGTQRWILQT